MPTHSMPIGQIPHALIVPYNELQLDECIGSGAEGKASVEHQQMCLATLVAGCGACQDTHLASCPALIKQQ